MFGQRRTVKTLLVEPFMQIRFGLYVAIVAIGFVGLFAWFFLSAFTEQYKQVAEIFDVADFNALLKNSVFIKNTITLGGLLIGFLGILLWVIFSRTHRMYGPMVNILKFLDELRVGNYTARIKVRENDDFQRLVVSLNLLAENLESKHSKI